MCFYLPPHKATICFCSEDVFNYTVPAKEKHNGILTRFLYLCRQLFRNISIRVTEAEPENTQMCLENLSSFLGLSDRIAFQKHRVSLYSRSCLEDSTGKPSPSPSSNRRASRYTLLRLRLILSFAEDKLSSTVGNANLLPSFSGFLIITQPWVRGTGSASSKRRCHIEADPFGP